MGLLRRRYAQQMVELEQQQADMVQLIKAGGLGRRPGTR